MAVKVQKKTVRQIKFLGSKVEDDAIARKEGETVMNNIFYIIGVVVVVLFIAGYFGLR